MLRRRSRFWLLGIMVLLVLFAVSRAPIGSWTMLATSPALDALHAPVQWWQSFSLWFNERQSLQARFESLQKRAQQQAALIQEAESLRDENRQLKKILDISGITGYHWHAAKVRGRSPESMSQRILLQVKDVSPDDVIVSSEGLVGLVESQTGLHATVRTILDASMAVPVTIPGTSLAALVRGQGDRLQISFVPLENAPNVGAVLYTSGAGGLFPPGIAVARITDIRPVPGQLFAQVDAVAIAHWQRDNWLAVASHMEGAQPSGQEDPQADGQP